MTSALRGREGVSQILTKGREVALAELTSQLVWLSAGSWCTIVPWHIPGRSQVVKSLGEQSSSPSNQWTFLDIWLGKISNREKRANSPHHLCTTSKNRGRWIRRLSAARSIRRHCWRWTIRTRRPLGRSWGTRSRSSRTSRPTSCRHILRECCTAAMPQGTRGPRVHRLPGGSSWLDLIRRATTLSVH